jgi:hypothetical protein
MALTARTAAGRTDGRASACCVAIAISARLSGPDPASKNVSAFAWTHALLTPWLWQTPTMTAAFRDAAGAGRASRGEYRRGPHWRTGWGGAGGRGACCTCFTDAKRAHMVEFAERIVVGDVG